MNIAAFVEANHMEMMLTCAYAVTALWPFRWIKRKKTDDHPQSKIGVNRFFDFNNPPLKKDNKPDKIDKYFSNEAEIVNLDAAITKFLTDKKPFLRRKYSVLDLAVDLNVPVVYLSGFINRYYKIHFNDLINKHRVMYCEMMMKNGEWENKKLAGMAFDSGFNNRNTFTAAFKKQTGQNPSEYLKDIKQDHSDSLLSNVKKKRIA